VFAQCASELQLVRQVVLVAQTYAPQFVAAVWVQVPAPEQVEAGW
jgi:hypothetical protein